MRGKGLPFSFAYWRETIFVTFVLCGGMEKGVRLLNGGVDCWKRYLTRGRVSYRQKWVALQSHGCLRESDPCSANSRHDFR